MNRLATFSIFSTSSTFPVLAALVVAFSAAVASTACFAAGDEAAMSSPLTAAPAGLTRAEVMAETQAAMARGELQPGHEWGIDVPPVRPPSQKLRADASAAGVVDATLMRR